MGYENKAAVATNREERMPRSSELGQETIEWSVGVRKMLEKVMEVNSWKSEFDFSEVECFLLNTRQIYLT